MGVLCIKNITPYTHHSVEIQNNPGSLYCSSPAPPLKKFEHPSESLDHVTEVKCRYVENYTDPHRLMYISNKKQRLFKFTVDQKINVPMYEKVKGIFPNSANQDD